MDMNSGLNAMNILPETLGQPFENYLSVISTSPNSDHRCWGLIHGMHRDVDSFRCIKTSKITRDISALRLHFMYIQSAR
jgi:hypothetical protein